MHIPYCCTIARHPGNAEQISNGKGQIGVEGINLSFPIREPLC